MKTESRQETRLNNVVNDSRGTVPVSEIVLWFLSDGRCEDDPRDQFVIMVMVVVHMGMQRWMLMLLMLMLMLMIHDHGIFDFRVVIFDSLFVRVIRHFLVIRITVCLNILIV